MTRRLILLRGGGDLASGVALRLFHAGFDVVIAELPRPLAVRRLVSFSEAVYEGQTTVEEVTARLVAPERIEETLSRREIPVIVDPNLDIIQTFDLGSLTALVDARLLKIPPQPLPAPVPLHIGLGPGFSAPLHCHAVIETQRGHNLGRVYWTGSPAPDSQHPEGDPRRVLRAGSDGTLIAHAKIGEHVNEGQLVAELADKYTRAGAQVHTPLAGVVRGLLRDGTEVSRGLKIGDVDPRDDSSYCRSVSDKALAIGGGVLEAILTKCN